MKIGTAGWAVALVLAGLGAAGCRPGEASGGGKSDGGRAAEAAVRVETDAAVAEAPADAAVPAPSPLPAPGGDLAGDFGRRMLAGSSDGALRRALAAAQMQEAFAAKVKGEREEDGAPAAASVGAGAPDPTVGGPANGGTADLSAPAPAAPVDAPAVCDVLVPGFYRCLAADLGTAVPDAEIGAAVAECRALAAALPAERQASFRACAGVGTCGGRTRCLAELSGRAAALPPEPPVAPTLPSTDPDLCGRLLGRMFACSAAPVDPSLRDEMVGRCTAELAVRRTADDTVVPRLEECLRVECAEVPDCVGEAWTEPPEEPELASPVDEVFGGQPDPARVAALPPAEREVCRRVAVRMEECWPALVEKMHGRSPMDEDSRKEMNELRARMLPGMENLCLNAALDDRDTFSEISGTRECFDLECVPMIDCVERLSGAQARRSPAETLPNSRPPEAFPAPRLTP